MLLEETTDEISLAGATLEATEMVAEEATEGVLATTLAAELGETAATEEVGTTEGAAEGCTEGSCDGVDATGTDSDSSGADAAGVGTTRTVEVDSSTALTERTWFTRRAWRPSWVA